MKKARANTNDYWDKKLLEVEEKDPNRWRHSGFKKMYIEGDSSSGSDHESYRYNRVSNTHITESKWPDVSWISSTNINIHSIQTFRLIAIEVVAADHEIVNLRQIHQNVDHQVMYVDDHHNRQYSAGEHRKNEPIPISVGVHLLRY